MKRAELLDHELGQPGARKPDIFLCTKSRLSLLGIGGGGGSVSASNTSPATVTSGSSITVNNAGSSSGGFNLNNQTFLIIAAIGLGALLLFGLFRRGRRR